jgi:Flp pilus assembly protein CpaB
VTRINGRQGIIPIVQNAEVLSAEGQLQNAPKDKNQQGVAIPSTVTLHVPAQEALKIILAASNGSVTLSLRSDNDSKQGTAGKPITERELLGANGLDVPSTFVKPEISVGIRGSNGKVEQFDLSDGRLIKKTEPAKPDIEWVAAN